MLKIYSGRDTFYQWDLDQKLIVNEPTANEVHFCNGLRDCSIVCEVFEEDGQRLVNVPNILFTTSLPFKAYLYDGCCTRQEVKFEVKRRSKPDNYVYTETEVKTWDDLYDRMAELELGSTAIIEVVELPIEDINDSLLYRTADGVYWYDGGWHELIDESDLDILEADIEEAKSIAKGAHQAVSFGNYETMITALNALPKDTYKIPQSIMIVTLDVPDLWVSGIAEESVAYTYVDDATLAEEIKTNGSVQIGYYVLSALETQKVDLTEYVKNTDYASSTSAGIMKLNRQCGYALNSKYELYILDASEADMPNRNVSGHNFQNRPMKYGQLDLALKSGLTSNKYTLTDEEKASALAWLGAVGVTDYATGSKAGVMKVPGNTGVYMYDGTLWLRLATNYEIKNKTNYFAIAPNRLDYAMKIGLTTNAETLTDDEKTAALKWLGAVSDTDVEYTCDKYNHRAIIEGYLADEYGFASGEIITEEELSKCEIDVEYGAYDGSYEGTLSLEGARVITLEGGYALSVPASYGCPDARVIVITDTEAFNRTCGCDLESTGIYLSYTQVDNDAMQVTLTTKVKALRTTAPKVSNDYLYLEGNPVIKALMTRIEALENK